MVNLTLVVPSQRISHIMKSMLHVRIHTVCTIVLRTLFYLTPGIVLLCADRQTDESYLEEYDTYYSYLINLR